ncbi:hypothetical protein B0A55_03406 [Friedmanniomyces simplex]|uniref:Uncharacterized protein n=1 Tax=Friedmanniomyces simplex TaxID=329884 RepID=A0A4U0XQW7_9PEZI|nr:hypothetical protein B0A55_03406 [Friedmanniomyces simplex]
MRFTPLLTTASLALTAFLSTASASHPYEPQAINAGLQQILDERRTTLTTTTVTRTTHTTSFVTETRPPAEKTAVVSTVLAPAQQTEVVQTWYKCKGPSRDESTATEHQGVESSRRLKTCSLGPGRTVPCDADAGGAVFKFGGGDEASQAVDYKVALSAVAFFPDEKSFDAALTDATPPEKCSGREGRTTLWYAKNWLISLHS